MCTRKISFDFENIVTQDMFLLLLSYAMHRYEIHMQIHTAFITAPNEETKQMKFHTQIKQTETTELINSQYCNDSRKIKVSIVAQKSSPTSWKQINIQLHTFERNRNTCDLIMQPPPSSKPLALCVTFCVY